MADPFTPRFVDLVRNFTSTAGTGNLMLGAAAPGFTSFTSALQPGDQFYYSVVGLEKTNESEVGRGTLQADGSIARQPVGGVLTDFAAGRKTVALVAAAEWFDSIEAVRGAPAPVATRAAMAALAASGAALLAEAGREGLFLFDGGNLSSAVAADTAQGLHVAPASDPTGASGAWVRKFEGPVNPRWFGLSAGNDPAKAAANDAAMAAMFACLRSRAYNLSSTTFQSLDPVLIPPGTYWIGGLDITDGTVRIEGSSATIGSGSGRYATILRVVAGKTGIRTQSIDTSGASTRDATAHIGSNSSLFCNLALVGGYTNIEGEHHGFHVRSRCAIENVYVEGFEGDGIFVDADSVTQGGNSTGTTIRNVKVRSCRDGVRFSGNNVSASYTLGLDTQSNRRWGLNDECTLGNTHVAFQDNASGQCDGSSTPCGVHYLGNWYGVIAGQEAAASTNAPSGTTADNAWWYYIKANAATTGFPDWVSGTTYRAGGIARTSKVNAPTLFLGCYAEQNQPKAQLVAQTMVIGGTLGGWMAHVADVGFGPAPYLRVSSQGWLQTNTGFAADGNISASGPMSRFGPQGSAASSNNTLVFDTTNTVNQFTFRSWSGGASQTDGTMSVQRGNGLALDSLVNIKLKRSGATIVTVDAARATIASDKALSLAPGAAPATPADGDLWYDLTSGKFRKQQAGVTSDLTVPDDASITYAKLQDVSASDKLLGRASAGSGVVEEIGCTAAGRTLIACADAAAQRAALEQIRGIGFHCAGPPGASEVIGGMIAPYALTISQANSSCKALVAASAATTLTINNNGVAIGSFDFAAGATVATATITAPAIAAGDQVTFHAPATPDGTLADIDGLLRE